MKNTDIRNKVGQRIKALRKKNNISQERFSLMTGINRSYLADIEKGNRNFSFDTLVKIAQGFDLSLSEFLEGIGY